MFFNLSIVNLFIVQPGIEDGDAQSISRGDLRRQSSKSSDVAATSSRRCVIAETPRFALLCLLLELFFLFPLCGNVRSKASSNEWREDAVVVSCRLVSRRARFSIRDERRLEMEDR
jgi:hypothetical protein